MSKAEILDVDFVYFDNYQQLLYSPTCKFNNEISKEISTLKNFCQNDRKIRKLLCHDMKGGYLDQERFRGGLVEVNNSFYTLFHWWDIDIFVYFSHHFITVPPPAWIKQAHLHGVLALGTFITESKGGESMCREIFCSTEVVDELAIKMIDLCVNCHFDGWLINIENVIEKEHLQNLSYFLVRLRSELKKVVGSHSLVIWYDSVTIQGKLDWQNELNHQNFMWFDQVDGIFLNYNWKDEYLQRSVANAQYRSTDVFVGVDVFGRGCLGGGGWNCCEALEAIDKHSLSTAVFAPGWSGGGWNCCEALEAIETSGWSFCLNDQLYKTEQKHA